MKILIAEDNMTFQLILGGLLKKQGHDVTAVESGRQAWNAYQAAYFPVVITDWQMPEMDGMALMREVRAKPYEKFTFVIMIATKGGKQSYLEAMKAGADDFIAKPPDEEQLAARLLVAERIVGVQNHVKQLEASLSVCSYCKNVLMGERWVSMEEFISLQTGMRSSHGVCPNCWETRVLPDLERFGIKVDESVR
jgi:sigma-B regulation protein RsbU (phosphoserine phosphatase)